MIYWEVIALIMMIELFELRHRFPIDYNFYINKMTNVVIDLGYNILYVYSVCRFCWYTNVFKTKCDYICIYIYVCGCTYVDI
jgi:hypothetical protein